jgi:hypothetical protein
MQRIASSTYVRFERWCYLGLIALLFLLPFETRAGLQLAGLLLTSVELLALTAVGLWVVALLYERRWPQLPRVALWTIVAFLGALFVSAALAPQERVSALKFALRQLQGGLLAICIVDALVVGGTALARRLLLALLGGACLSAALGLWELGESQMALGLLSHFKTQPSLMESLLRLSGTFAYANIAAMYFEALLPAALLLATGLLWPTGRSAKAHVLRPYAGGVAMLLLTTALVFTYSRAALGVLLLLLLATLAMVLRRWGRGPTLWRALASGGLLMALLTALSVLSPVLRLRFSAPDTARWYDARYLPSELGTLRTNELRTVAIEISNSGQASWRHDGLRPVMLAYHWYDAATRRLVDFEGLRTPLPRTIAPQESITLMAQVRAPQRPGTYLLGWDLVRENGGGWFSQGRTAITYTPATVVANRADASAPVSAAFVPIAPPPPSPPRRVLWGIAVDLWRERPLLGIGPDVFRHMYGARMGLAQWDERIHTNNLYLEVLTGTGLLGFAAFTTLLFSALLPALSRLLGQRLLSDEHWAVLAASVLGLGAFLVHGALDVFLAFTATYALFWAMLGLTIGLSTCCAVAAAMDSNDHLQSAVCDQKSATCPSKQQGDAYRARGL